MIRQVWHIIGPGMLMAGAAIGVSHLVQSTRAGADFGFEALWFVVLANVMKYPFFQFGHRYAAITGDNLLTAYRRLGKGYLYLFIGLNCVTSVGSIAAVTFVTAALLQNMLGNTLSIAQYSLALLVVSSAIIGIGHYHWLDRLIKVFMVILVVATVAAFAAAVHYGLAQPRPVTNSNMLTLASLPFIIALMGWMPAPMEMSVWQSLWVQAKARDIKRAITLREAMLDFNMGYWLTAVLAVMFLTLGAVIMYGSGTTFADGSAAFAGQVVALYTSVMGEWSLPVIMMAAFVTMFSTTFTLVDGYPRSLSEGLKVALPHWQRAERKVRPYIMGVALLLAYGVIAQHANAMKALVDLVTTIAFLATPIFAWMNYRVLTTSLTPVSGQPSQGLRMWCWLGLLYLTGFALLYLALKLNFV